mmetsp:Transcript_35450/g.102366  ORF Transcript_35450/g.102366 Transcript_35450/m.102366 type:complete len:550 (+) Transcript_35450:1-1650(+)
MWVWLPCLLLLWRVRLTASARAKPARDVERRAAAWALPRPSGSLAEDAALLEAATWNSAAMPRRQKRKRPTGLAPTLQPKGMFVKLLEVGFWDLSSCTSKGVDAMPAWLHDALEANLPWSFVYRRFTMDGKRVRFYAFGGEVNKQNFFVPCVDLVEDGSSWVGRVMRDRAVSRGSGTLVMGKMLDDLDNVAGAGSDYRCRITPDDGNNPSLVTWELGAVDHAPSYILEFRPSLPDFAPPVLAPTVETTPGPPVPVNLPKRRPGAKDFGRLMDWGNWKLVNRRAAEKKHRWLRDARLAGLNFSFTYRQYTVEGIRLSKYGFGGVSTRTNCAVMCIQVTGRYKNWTADATGYEAYHRGPGNRVMDGFWHDLGNRMRGARNATNLKCRFTFDDAEDASRMLWEVVRDIWGKPLISVAWKRRPFSNKGRTMPFVGGGRPARSALANKNTAFDAKVHDIVNGDVAVEPDFGDGGDNGMRPFDDTNAFAWKATEPGGEDKSVPHDFQELNHSNFDELPTEEILSPDMFSGIKGYSVAEIESGDSTAYGSSGARGH